MAYDMDVIKMWVESDRFKESCEFFEEQNRKIDEESARMFNELLITGKTTYRIPYQKEENMEELKSTTLADWMVDWNRDEIQRTLDDIQNRNNKILKELLPFLEGAIKSSKNGRVAYVGVTINSSRDVKELKDWVDFIKNETYGTGK